ncbi:MAG TPA: MotA/TolQ/ExbB proton channel family protein, partial [Xanthobacteraceae bacterium]|nr:MotA/TolQ/ExbB proton channel family protein [Xanthobacteraceae bacterium]
MRLKPLGILGLLAVMLVPVGAAIVNPGGAMAQAPKAETAPAAATEVKPGPAEVKPLPPAAPPATEVVENPYGLEALWKQGDFVARGTLIILMIMSIGSWYIGIVKVIEQARMMKDAKEADAKFWHAKSVQEGVATLKEDSAFRFVAEKSLLAAQHHATMQTKQLDLNTWVGMALQRAIDVVSNRLQSGLAFLATVGSTAPFVGLFGTVWGIYHALTAIGIAGQASIDKVAGPVGEALIMTALGLAVAVPAVLGYNWLVRRNRVAMELIRHFGGGVDMLLLGRGGRTRKDSES